MFTGKINGVRLLQDGNVTVTLTCAGDNLQSIANSRAGEVTIYAKDEAPATDSRLTVLTNLHSVALQIAEAIDRELGQSHIPEIPETAEANLPLLAEMMIMK